MKIVNKLVTILVLTSLLSVQESVCTSKANAWHDSDAAYYTRQINMSNGLEVDYVARMLFYKEYLVPSYASCRSKSHIQSDTSNTCTSHKEYRPMTEQEKTTELARAKAEVLRFVGNNNKIFVCSSVKDNMIYGLMCAEHGIKQIDLVEVIQVYVNPEACVNSHDVMCSMIQFTESFYKKLSMSGIAIHLCSQDYSFYVQNGYVQLSREEMISRKLASHSKFVCTSAILAALAGFAGYRMSHNYFSTFNMPKNVAIALLSGLASLPLIFAGYDYMNNTVYYKAL
jgi:hypothetical protein